MKKIRIVAMIAAILTFMCAYLLMRTPDDGASANRNDGEIAAVVAAKQDIAPYTTLTEDMLSVVEMPVTEGTEYFSKLDEVVGKVSVSDIYAGEALTSRRIVSADDAVLGLSAKIDDGKRAITINVDTEQGVGNHLKVGNYVDVVFRSEVDAGSLNGTRVPAGTAFTSAYGAESPKNSAVMQENFNTQFSVITVQDVKVLAVENLTYFSANGTEYAHVTLEVTPAQAEDLALMNDAAGWIQLILRAQDDHDILDENRHVVLEK